MDEALRELKNLMELYIKNDLSGSVSVKINFFKGGITTINKSTEETRKPIKSN